MLFNSVHYLLFFPIVAVLFFGLPARFRILWLVLASCYFYMVFRPAYILILFAVITIDYFSGLYIERHRPQASGLPCTCCSFRRWLRDRSSGRRGCCASCT